MMNKKEMWKNIGQQSIKDIWNILGAIAVICTIVGVSLEKSNYKTEWILCSIIVFLIITFWRTTDKLISNKIESKDLDVPTEIQKIIKYFYDKKNYHDVVSLGSAISLFLLRKGYNIQRVAIGKMIEDSAKKTKNVKAQISALIDDIGWSYFLIKNPNKAKTNITNGINKAKSKENQLYYFAAKGERHLAGIAAKENRNNILTHLNNAQQYTERVTDIPQKNEMNASLFLAKAEYYYEEANYLEAERNLLDARSLFENDANRIVKTHSLLGNIYLAQNTEESIQKAKDEFNDGYTNCANIRKDEYAKNAVGLAKIEMREFNFGNAKRYLEEAKHIFKDSVELEEVNNLLTKIKNGTT
jgi:tetratricopeptide (TPR) repeat protein